jgi:hypothetical protein
MTKDSILVPLNLKDCKPLAFLASRLGLRFLRTNRLDQRLELASFVLTGTNVYPKAGTPM